MNPLLEVWLVAARDLRKNTRSVKGVVMLGISLLGAVASTLKLPEFEKVLEQANQLSADELLEAKGKLFAKMYGDDALGTKLASAPIKLVVLFFIAVWLTPLLVMVLGFDGISSDLQYRSVRYWTVRTRRPSYYVGKYLALWTTVSAITLIMQVLIWAVTIVRAEASATETLTWGVRFWFTSLPITGAWCGVATLCGSLYRTPVLGLLTTGVVFFLLFFFGFILGKGRGVDTLALLYPNNFDGWILSPKGDRMLEGLGVCAAFVVGTAGAGIATLQARDV